MDVLRTVSPSQHKDAASGSVALLFVFALVLAVIAAAIGAVFGSVVSAIAGMFGVTFISAWGHYGFLVALIVAILAFIVLLAISTVIVVGALMEGTGPGPRGSRARGGSRV